MLPLVLSLPVLLCQVPAADQSALPAMLARAPHLPTEQLLTLRARLAAEPIAAAAKAYHELNLAYLLASRSRGSDPRGAEALVERSLKALEGSQDPERMALQGAFLGLKIGYAPGSAMTLAPKALALFGRAESAAPDNPRVLLLKGVHLLHTPAFFGGGAGNALPLLTAAVAAADKERTPADPWAPAWGRVEALTWLALVQLQLNRPEAAQASVDRARALDPVNSLLEALVQPKLAELAK